MNVGSRTRAANKVKGVWEHSLTTRPINDLLPKIQVKEKAMKEAGTIPVVVVCGSGAAGTELSFAFKARWSKYFGEEIKVTLIGSSEEPVPEQIDITRRNIIRKLKEHNIEYVGGQHITEIKEDGVVLSNGDVVPCNVPVWATGAEAQQVTAESDLDMLKGYFRVNNFMQSTSHPNVFAGGDCVEMESYQDKPYPTKAGVYAVRAGPIIAANLVAFLSEKPLTEYVPQESFLSLMMTADRSCLGSRFGLCFVGKWVWELKDFIDMGFMDLFNPKYLFKDYETKGTAEPIENFIMYEEETGKKKQMMEELKAKVYQMDPPEAASVLSAAEDDMEFHTKW